MSRRAGALACWGRTARASRRPCGCSPHRRWPTGAGSRYWATSCRAKASRRAWRWASCRSWTTPTRSWPAGRPSRGSRACTGALVRAYAGEEVLEVYGRAERLAEVGELALRNGWPSRRSGPALAILRAESLDGQVPEGVRRPANLEDAFVALTGEEIE